MIRVPYQNNFCQNVNTIYPRDVSPKQSRGMGLMQPKNINYVQIGGISYASGYTTILIQLVSLLDVSSDIYVNITS